MSCRSSSCQTIRFIFKRRYSMTPLKSLLATAGLLMAALLAHAQNPLNLGSKILTADPSGHVWADGKMYLYTSHDEECQEDFWMKDWHVFSSSDLVNWQDHGAVLTVKDVSWADNYAWAPDCAYKDGKYSFCFPAGTGHRDRVNPERSTKWMGIGIAESDSPTGQWKYRGLIMEEEGESNNHHSIVEFEGQWILFYHRWLKTDSACDKPQRHTCAEYLYFNEDGTIREVKRTKQGVSIPVRLNRPGR